MICIGTECVSDHGKKACKNIGGICHIETDGYYIVSGVCMALGMILLLAFIIPTARRLQGILHTLSLVLLRITPAALPISVWRIKM